MTTAADYAAADFWGQVCRDLGAQLTPGREQFFDRWAHGEATGAKWNPLATTLHGIEDAAAPYWNTFAEDKPYGPLHVKNYASDSDGASATAATIRQANFAAIAAAILTEQIGDRAALAAQLDAWGTTAFAQDIRDGWTPAAWSQPAPMTPGIAHGVTLEEAVASLNNLNAAVVREKARMRRAFDSLAEGVTLAIAELHAE